MDKLARVTRITIDTMSTEPQVTIAVWDAGHIRLCAFHAIAEDGVLS
jgi:hypothetical protein